MRRAILTGSQAKLVGGAAATILTWAWNAAAPAVATLPAEVGGALAVIIITVLDVWLADGAPTDQAPAPHAQDNHP